MKPMCAAASVRPTTADEKNSLERSPLSVKALESWMRSGR